MSMNIDELAAQEPQLYQAVYNRGIEDGRTAGIAEGTKNEQERIAAVLELECPGGEAIVRQALTDPTQNAGTVAMAIVKENAKVLKNARESLAAEGAAVAEALRGVGAAQAFAYSNENRQEEAAARRLSDALKTVR